MTNNQVHTDSVVLDFEILKSFVLLGTQYELLKLPVTCKTTSHRTAAFLDTDRSARCSTDHVGRGLGVCSSHQQFQRSSALEGTGHRAGDANDSGLEDPNHVGSTGICRQHSPDKSTARSALLWLE